MGNPYGIIDPHTGLEFTQTKVFYGPDGNELVLDPVQLTQHARWPELEPMVRTDPDPQLRLDWLAGNVAARKDRPVTFGQIPGSGPLAMSTIRDQLGGANDLGWYRGRRYYNYATGQMQTISQNPSFAEFYNLGTVPPVTDGHMANWGVNVDIEIGIAYAPWDGGYYVEIQATGSDWVLSMDIAGYYDVSRYTSITNRAAWFAGDGAVGFSTYRWATPQGGTAGFKAEHAPSGARQAYAHLFITAS